MSIVKPAVETCTEKHFDLPSQYDNEKDKIPNAPQGYAFMAYLRHNGFPSPLLDWTRSFYIAAFFAFQPAKGKDTPVAIYSYIESRDGGKGSWADEATIVGVGPCVTTDKRHFLQQSEYTFCKKKHPEKYYVYCNHEEAFARDSDEQDILFKYVIPATERTKVIDRLHGMNINEYSLFGSEESLLATLAYQEIKNL